MSEQKKDIHNIQLAKLDIVRLAYETQTLIKQPIDFNKLLITGGCNCDDNNLSILQFQVKCEYEAEEQYKIEIVLVAFFEFTSDNQQNLTKEEFINWGDKNAINLIFPYLREQLFALTSRVGIEPYFLPLIIAK